MSAQRSVPSPNVFRAALLALGGVQALLGLYAVVWPLGFYQDFPLGRGWVEALPAYSEHLVRDVGGLFLLSGAVLVGAAILLERRLVALALASFLLYSVPHTIFHFLNFGPYGTADVVANVLGLGAQVVVPLWLLGILFSTRDRPPKAVGVGTAPGAHPPAGRAPESH